MGLVFSVFAKSNSVATKRLTMKIKYFSPLCLLLKWWNFCIVNLQDLCWNCMSCQDGMTNPPQTSKFWKIWNTIEVERSVLIKNSYITIFFIILMKYYEFHKQGLLSEPIAAHPYMFFQTMTKCWDCLRQSLQLLALIGFLSKNYESKKN